MKAMGLSCPTGRRTSTEAVLLGGLCNIPYPFTVKLWVNSSGLRWYQKMHSSSQDKNAYGHDMIARCNDNMYLLDRGG